MTKYFLSLVFCFSFWSAQAHQADISSTMLVEQADNKWVLHIRTALTAFDYTIKAKYPANSYKTAEEFQALVLEHVKENLQIKFNDQDSAILQNGVVKLGHETSMTFEVIGVPKTFNTIYVKNSSFKTIHRNQSALIILKKGFNKNQFVLNKQNDHAIHLKVADADFVPLQTAEVLPAKINVNYTYGGILLLLMGVVAFSFIRYFK